MADLPDPNAVVTALTRNGWTVAGGQPARFVRLAVPPGWPGKTITVPLDKSAGDFGDLMGDVLAELADGDLNGRRAAAVLDTINPTTSGVPAQVVKEATDLVYDPWTEPGCERPPLVFLMGSHGYPEGAPRSAAAVVAMVAPLFYEAGKRAEVGS
jgi:hypothetical protein